MLLLVIGEHLDRLQMLTKQVGKHGLEQDKMVEPDLVLQGAYLKVFQVHPMICLQGSTTRAIEHALD